jgi:hypothetical protein
MAKEKEVKEVKRVFGTEKKVITDTFKLTVETMKKDIGVDNAPVPRIEPCEHVHIYRTYSSNGKFNKTCSAVGGHTHKVEVTEENGEFKVVVGPAIDERGNPVVFGKKNKIYDTHTHEAVYLRSDEINLKKKDADVARFIASKESAWLASDVKN